jgi:fused signal recognition particle receptor
MAFGFIKKVFSFGRKEVVEEKPDEAAPLPPLNFDALKPAEEVAPASPSPLRGGSIGEADRGGVDEAARGLDLETPSPVEATPSGLSGHLPLEEGEPLAPAEPTPEIRPEPAPETEPAPPPEQPITPPPETPPSKPQEVPPEPVRPEPEPAQPEPAPPEIPSAPAPQPEKPEVPAPGPEAPEPPAEVPPSPPQEEPAPQPVEIPAEPEPMPVEVPMEQAPPAPLPLEGRVTAERSGGAGETARGLETPSPAEATPSGPEPVLGLAVGKTRGGHLPLKGGEEPVPGKVTVARKVEQKAESAPAPKPPEPKKSWFQRMREGLARSSRELTGNIAGVFTKRKLDEDTLQDLEDILIRADLGVETALRVTDSLASSRYGKTISDDEVRTVMADEIGKVLTPVALPLELDLSHKPHVILVVGVNGTGKTTTIGKLAAKLTAGGLSVMLAAGDTFRAAAIEQLKIWGERTNSPVVATKLGADAAGLAYDAFEKAKEASSDVLIIDTAGRLQNKTELMAELEKIVRVLGKLDPEAPHTVLQTVDATTGQNALNQVEIFRNVAGVNGLVMTKLDGTARGGILVAIAAKHKLPVYFIGVGEQVDDLEPFSANDFARAIAGVA